MELVAKTDKTCDIAITRIPKEQPHFRNEGLAEESNSSTPSSFLPLLLLLLLFSD
jgi:hypothetical protein